MSNKPSIFNLYGTDKKAEEEGKWISLGGEIEVCLRRFTSKKSQEVRKTLFRAYEQRPGMLKAPVIPDDVNTDLTNKHLAQGVIVDWKGIYGIDGSEIPFTAENAEQLLKDLPDFGLEIVRASIDMDTFRTAATDIVRGN